MADMMQRISVYIAFLLMLMAAGSHAADDFPGIENLMTAAQFRDAGLEKLSPEQLGGLNKWLTSYTANEAPIVKQTSRSVKKAQTVLVTSQIDGKFNGWTGKTVFRLKNGQVWRQRYSGRYWYSAVNPEVEIKKNMLGFYQMKMMATGKTIGVKRIE